MITRRQLLVATAAAAGGGLIVGLRPQIERLESRLFHAPPLGEPGWVQIGRDGEVRLYCTLTEMGQGVWSAFAQIVNEELDADWTKVRVEMAPTWRAYGTPVGFYTGGSTSIERIFTPMRSIGAAARVLLTEAAARSWRVPASQCVARAGQVLHVASGRRLSYGELAPAAARLPVPADLPLKPRAQWRAIGRSLPRLGTSSQVDGRACYGIDIRLEGMLTAALSQSPWPAGALASFDRAAALREAGVRQVIRLRDGVAVLARDYWSAARGLDRARVTWRPPGDAPDTERLRTGLAHLLRQGAAEGSVGHTAGRRVTATYEVPLLMHMQLEPLNATARVHRFGAQLWAPTQVPTLMQHEVARALSLLPQAVTVHATRVGGSFGRRLSADEGVVAARIARAAGAPVKTLWSREEDSRHDHFRPMAMARLEATLGTDGAPAALSVHLASLGTDERTAGFAPHPYDIANSRVRYSGLTTPVRTGYWRSVDASQNVFFRESFLDECAHAAGSDPLEYRMRLLGAGHGRGRRVLAQLGTACGWNAARPQDRFLGLAYDEGFSSVSAQAVELSRSGSGTLRIERIVVVVDCGTAVNPDNIRAQIEGGALFALSAALREEAAFAHGHLVQTNFDAYPVLRIGDAVAVQVHILETPDAPIGGLGEVGVPPLAPALANALFAATGTRIRRLPLSRAALRWAG